MSTYQGIRGLKVRDYTTNPDDPLEGQLWYNKTDQVGKYQVPIVTSTGAWRTANSINTARDDGYMVGAQTSAILFGGKTNPPPSRIGVVESYDGVSFTEVNDFNTARGGTFGGGVSNTSAIAAGGQTGSGDGTAVANVETWNGSSWTETTDINSARFLGASGGTSTSTLIFGGYPAGGGAPGYADKTESWNGSAWTEVGDLNLGRGYFGGAGASNALALGFGGDIPATPARAQTESWNGSSWTEVNDLNTARYGSHYGGIGTYIDTLCVGGYTEQAVVEQWNGSSWTEVADIATGRENLSAAGSNTNGAIMAGGSTSTTAQLATAQEWNNAVPLGAWSSSGSLNTARRQGGSAGIYTSALYFGGYSTTYVASTESWDGTSWTEVNDLNLSRGFAGGSGASNTAALAFGGFITAHETETELWNGSSWTEVNDLNTARYNASGSGTSTATLAFGGNVPPNDGTAVTEEWNGTSWTEVNDLNTAREASGASGNTEAMLGYGGLGPPTVANTENWNGTSWTEVNDLNTARQNLGGSGQGTNTLALAFGGQTPAPTVYARTEDWNGASWVELADLSTGRFGLGSAGTAANALAFGGYSTTNVTATEEWSGSTNSTKTIDTD